MASSVWTGYLTFGLISMPVRTFRMKAKQYGIDREGG